MVTVEADVDQVECRLAAGELSCPACGGVLAGWGRARPRQLRGPHGSVELYPRRSRCTGCRVTHVLLPVTALLRRADTAAVIVSALAAKATSRAGFRRIATDLARPAETVRGWLRRFAGRVEAVLAPSQYLAAGEPRQQTPEPLANSVDTPVALKSQSSQAEAQAIMLALQASNGQVTRAASLLGISRTTLWRKMAKYGLAEPRDHIP